MEYGQIVCFLFIALLLYYVVLIVLDMQRAKAAQAAEQDNQAEEDIDISEEARTFQAVKVSREEPVRQGDTSRPNGFSSNDKMGDSDIGQSFETEKPFHRTGYREAVMTDGILVDDIIREIDKLAETGTSDLGTVIYTCENAR